jgi:dTMP kinase
MGRGQLILIEGLDRSGKSTQTEILQSKLQQRGGQAELIKFPDRSTKIGSIINQYLTDKSFTLPDQAAHLLFLANRWELAVEIERMLNDGAFVVLDRYIYSGIAYSLAKLIQNPSTTSKEMANIEWLYAPDKGLPKPDLTLFLTLDLDQIGDRKGWGEERYEMTEFQSKVKQCFLQILSQDSVISNENVVLVDVNNKLIEQVTELLWDKIVENNANVLLDTPINYLT